MHRVMGVDIETYSSVDLTDAGVYAYTEAPDFDILLISYIFDDWGEDDVKTIDCFDADPDMMAEFCEALLDPQIVKTAFNANFERTCLAKWLNKPMPPEEWRCTMVKALTLGLPGNLAGAGVALGLPAEKLKDPQGKALIQFFSKPCKPTRTNGQRTRNLPAHDPAKWQLYKNYNRQDVVTEQEILRKLSIYKTPEDEQALWSLDQHMNDNGVRLDIPMVEKIVEYDTRRRQELQEEAQELTGLKNPNSLAQLKRWLSEQGVEMANVTKDTIAEALQDPALPEVVRRVLEIRTALGKTSVAKYSTMLVAHCQDHRLRGILQFYGANRSGRWAGRLVQTHNLAKNSLPDLALARELAAEGDFDTMGTLFGETAFVFSELIRTAFIPSDGCRFIVSDFSAIEARVLAWLAGEEWVLEAFRNGEDIHARTAALVYDLPPDQVNPDQRRNAKTINFGLIYGMGAQKLAQELKISTTQAKDFIARYFERLQGLKEFYEGVEASARKHGFVTTLGGRRRLLPDINSASGQAAALARRQAINTVIQGSAADIIKLAMLAVARDEHLRELDARLLLQVHDELLLEVPADAAEEAGALVARLMQDVCPAGKELSVPLLVDWGTGHDWGAAH